MAGFLLIVGFPLVLAGGFGGLYAVAYALGRGREAVDRSGLLLYPLLLALPFTVALVAAARGGLLVRTGLTPPQVAGWPAAAALAAGLAVGVASGAVLYLGELGIARLSRRLAGGRFQRTLEGRSDALVGTQRELSPAVTLGLSLFIAFAEEFLWRGYLIYFLTDVLALSTGAALALSAAAFGINHYYFGLRNVALKALLGAAWGLSLVATGSLAVAVASHATFDLLAWRGARR